MKDGPAAAARRAIAEAAAEDAKAEALFSSFASDMKTLEEDLEGEEREADLLGAANDGGVDDTDAAERREADGAEWSPPNVDIDERPQRKKLRPQSVATDVLLTKIESEANAVLRARLTAFFHDVKPSEVRRVPALLKKYKGREPAMLRALQRKFGRAVPSALDLAARVDGTAAGGKAKRSLLSTLTGGKFGEGAHRRKLSTLTGGKFGEGAHRRKLQSVVRGVARGTTAFSPPTHSEVAAAPLPAVEPEESGFWESAIAAQQAEASATPLADFDDLYGDASTPREAAAEAPSASAASAPPAVFAEALSGALHHDLLGRASQPPGALAATRAVLEAAQRGGGAAGRRFSVNTTAQFSKLQQQREAVVPHVADAATPEAAGAAAANAAHSAAAHSAVLRSAERGHAAATAAMRTQLAHEHADQLEAARAAWRVREQVSFCLPLHYTRILLTV